MRGVVVILISHRGTVEGRVVERENTPAYLEEALKAGFEVEVDVWFLEGEFWLGHDRGEVRTELEFLKREGFWVHAKNLAGLYELRRAGAHCFFHESDDATLTSRGFIWTYPGKMLTGLSICVLPERGGVEGMEGCAGVCSDSVARYR